MYKRQGSPGGSAGRPCPRLAGQAPQASLSRFAITKRRPKGRRFYWSAGLLLEQAAVGHLDRGTAACEEAAELGLHLGGDGAGRIEVLVRCQQRAVPPGHEAGRSVVGGAGGRGAQLAAGT